MVFQNFIVLGIIPGTDIQINFLQWLLATVVLVAVWELRHIIRAHHRKISTLIIPTIGGDITVTK